MDKNKTWKIQSEKKILDTKIYSIFELNCFLKSKELYHNFYSIHICDWVNIFAVTEDDKIIFVKQHRVGKNQITLEGPAGGIDNSEAPEAAAVRELHEETGYTPKELILLKKIAVNPAIQNNDCYFYLAIGCKKDKETNFDTAEELEVVLKDKQEVFNSILNSDLVDNSLAFMAIMLARDYFNKGK